jgi:hypothetical protein
VRIRIRLKRLTQVILFMPLNCHYPSWDSSASRKVGICLHSLGDGIYARVNAGRFLLEPSSFLSEHLIAGSSHSLRTQIYLSRHLKPIEVEALKAPHRLEFKIIYHILSGFARRDLEPRSQWDALNELFMVPFKISSFFGYQDLANVYYDDRFLVVFGYKPPNTPWVCLARSSSNPILYQAAESLDMFTAATLGRQHQTTSMEVRKGFSLHNWYASLDTTVTNSSGMTFTRFNIWVS